LTTRLRDRDPTKCDAGRRPGASSLVLETLGWTVRDLFPHDNRDVAVILHHALIGPAS